jgi:glycosyltransferase involved in cell wall biosynthesis
MIYNYGVQTVIRSIPLLVARIPNLELKIVGHGEYLDKLISLAHELGVEERVHFTGWVPHKEIPGIISQADVGIVAMLTDLMLPTKLFEYVAMTKPVVVTALPTMKAYFGEDCLTFYEPDNEQDLARSILEVYSQPSKARSMALRASELYENYRWRNSKHDYLRVYEELLR